MTGRSDHIWVGHHRSLTLEHDFHHLTPLRDLLLHGELLIIRRLEDDHVFLVSDGSHDDECIKVLGGAIWWGNFAKGEGGLFEGVCVMKV